MVVGRRAGPGNGGRSVVPAEMSEVSVEVRRGDRADRSFVKSLSGEAFSRFGSYDRVLPPLLSERGVHTLVAESSGTPVGFALLRLGAEAELVAIAVTAEWRRKGVARLLLDGIERVALEACRGDSCTIRLTVAVDNASARRLFERVGYAIDDDDRGFYPAGQQSIGMWKRV